MLRSATKIKLVKSLSSKIDFQNRSLLRRVLGVVFSLCLLSMGCEPQNQGSTASTTAIPNKDRPPLRVWIVDAPELQKEIELRWQAASDMPIRIELLSVSEVLQKESFQADVVLYPEHLIGELVSSDKIAKLPKRPGEKSSRSEAAPGESLSEKETSLETTSMPKRWIRSGSFGGEDYAAALGSPQLVAIARGISIDSLNALHQALESGDEIKELAFEKWDAFLEASRIGAASTAEERAAILKQRLSALTDSERDWLVDRFLWIASTSEAKRRGLFDLAQVQSRLGQPEFVKSATVLSELLQRFPETMLTEPVHSWEELKHQKTGFAIGWPRTDGSEETSETNANDHSLTLAPLAWNPNRGLNVSLGSKSRQTAISTQFIFWMTELSQREALHALNPGIELLSDEPDRNMIREDYRNYQAINNRDSRFESAEVSMRFKNATSYRKLLADALVDIAQRPEIAKDRLSRCKDQWNELTQSGKVTVLRQSIEQSHGFKR